MTEEKKKNMRTLIVTGYEHLGSFDRNGVTNNIYGVTATTPQGETIGLKLRSFKEMDEYMGKEVEFEVRPYEHKTEGMTYTLLPPKKKLTEQVDELRERIQTLEGKVQALVDWRSNQESGVPPAQPPPIPGDRREHRQPTSTKHRSDDDIPF